MIKLHCRLHELIKSLHCILIAIVDNLKNLKFYEPVSVWKSEFSFLPHYLWLQVKLVLWVHFLCHPCFVKTKQLNKQTNKQLVSQSAHYRWDCYGVNIHDDESMVSISIFLALQLPSVYKMDIFKFSLPHWKNKSSYMAILMKCVLPAFSLSCISY